MSKGTPTPLACPSEPDERAEAFVMMKLLPQKAESFLLHMADCESCWQRVATYDKYVRAMKAAGDKDYHSAFTSSVNLHKTEERRTTTIRGDAPQVLCDAVV